MITWHCHLATLEITIHMKSLSLSLAHTLRPINPNITSPTISTVAQIVLKKLVLVTLYYGLQSLLSKTINTKGDFIHEIDNPWPLPFEHSHQWKRWSWSKFASHYTWGTNGVCECNMDVKSTHTPTWHRMDHVSWSLRLFKKTTSWR